MLLLHLKTNLLLLGLWIVLFLLTTGQIGRKLGSKYLFLDPEYLGEVNFLSYFFMGLAFGGFFMTWNLTTYLLNAQRFPFLASLARPFTKFCLNNGIIPFAYFLYYLSWIVYFQGAFEQWDIGRIAGNALGFLLGTLVLVSLYALYFTFTNKDISDFNRQGFDPPNLSRPPSPGRRDVDLNRMRTGDYQKRVRTYLNEMLRPRLVRSVAHYDSAMLLSIFRQNHFNALILQLLTMMSLFMLGALIDYPLFRIPAAASVIILLSLIIALLGAITFWFSAWRITIIVLLLVAINYLTRLDTFSYDNKAYGLNYEVPAAEYSYQRLLDVCTPEQIEEDKAGTIEILENWKKRVQRHPGEKPKMVILSVSGGGLRSAIWTLQVVQKADSLLNGRLLDHSVLVTGASGGLIGMSYLRELYLRKQLGDSIRLYDEQHIMNISKDLLNPVTFALVSNDLFLPSGWFEYAGQPYRKDRGYIFEQQLNENTGYVLEKQIGDYRQPEREALIPMLYITPAIVNDARRLIISPHGVSFMMVAPIGPDRFDEVEIEAADFGKIFARQNAYDLRFLTALRMNATYPYILPNVHMPSQPEIEVMDAGFRDNSGLLSATRFIQVFRPWIIANTSGVVLVQISSSEKVEAIMQSEEQGIVESLFNPLGIAGRLLSLQEFEQDNSLSFTYDLLGKEYFDFVRFMYWPGKAGELQATISFHITDRERKVVLDAIKEPENQSSLRQLVDLLGRQPGK